MTDLALYSDPSTLPSGEAARLARLLALDPTKIQDDVSLARQVSSGLPTRAASSLADFLGGASALSKIVPEATLRRLRKARKPLTKEHSERLYEMGRIVDAVSRIYRGNETEIRAFLTRPHPLLEGETPFDMARSSSAGTDAVLNLLSRAEAGVAL